MALTEKDKKKIGEEELFRAKPRENFQKLLSFQAKFHELFFNCFIIN